MKDEALNRRLRSFGAPSPGGQSRARARHRALLAFQQPEREKDSAETSTPRLRIWPGLATGVLLVVAVAFWKWPRAPIENLANDREILRQVEELFPHQLNAVVERGGQTDLSLSESTGLGFDQPVLLIFRRQNEVIRVLSFSGHRVCVPLGARDTCFEVLETADGGVILESDKNVLLLSEHPMVAGYALHARTFSL